MDQTRIENTIAVLQEALRLERRYFGVMGPTEVVTAP
jgi:hypothetical protein